MTSSRAPSPAPSEPLWLSDLREIHAKSLGVNWASQLDMINERFGFAGNAKLSTAQNGAPPAWFNGDVEAIHGNRWVLVLSLNPQKPPEGHYKGQLNSESSWDFWRTHNVEWWYTKFFRPLVRLSATALGEPVPSAGTDERLFASKRMVFVELCPYASKSFSLTSDQLLEMSTEDPGFAIARNVRDILIHEATPSLILVNGQSSIDELAAVDSERLEWIRCDYVLATRRGGTKAAWHMEGWYSTESGDIPVVGFKFLNKPPNHNGNFEIDQLGERASEFVHLNRTRT